MPSVFANKIREILARRSLARIGFRRGSIILIVLITLMFAGVALTLFIEKASNDLLVEVRDADAARLRLEAYSALETSLGVIEDFRQVLGQLHSPSEGWGDPLGFAHYEPAAGRTVDVAFEDESAKLSLPNVDAATLGQLFLSWGLPEPKAEGMRDALLGWMHNEYVGSAADAPRPEDYSRGDLPFVPPGRSLRSFSELSSINYVKDLLYDEKGQPNDLWRRFASAFSLYSYKQSNINGGNGDVLASLGIQDPSQMRLVKDYLAGKAANQAAGSVTYFRNSQDVSGLLGANSPAVKLGTQIMALRIIITVHQGRSTFRLDTVVAPQGGASVPKAPANATSVAANLNGQSTSPTQNPAAAPSPSTPPGTNTGTAPASTTSGTAVQAVPRSITSNNGGVTNSLNYPFTILEIREND